MYIASLSSLGLSGAGIIDKWVGGGVIFCTISKCRVAGVYSTYHAM